MVVLLIFVFLAIYYYQLRIISIYIDTNNTCGWSNGKITIQTTAVEWIKTVKIHRYQLASQIKNAENHQECLSTTYQGNY